MHRDGSTTWPRDRQGREAYGAVVPARQCIHVVPADSMRTALPSFDPIPVSTGRAPRPTYTTHQIVQLPQPPSIDLTYIKQRADNERHRVSFFRAFVRACVRAGQQSDCTPRKPSASERASDACAMRKRAGMMTERIEKDKAEIQAVAEGQRRSGNAGFWNQGAGAGSRRRRERWRDRETATGGGRQSRGGWRSRDSEARMRSDAWESAAHMTRHLQHYIQYQQRRSGGLSPRRCRRQRRRPWH